MLLSFYLPPWGITAGAALAFAGGLLAGLLPAVAAMRLQVVEALRRL